ERLGAMLVGVFPGVVDGPAPIHRPVHRAVHLVPIEGRVERVDVAVDAPRVVAIHELASSSLGVGWGSHGPYVRPGPGRRQLRDGRRNRRISAFASGHRDGVVGHHEARHGPRPEPGCQTSGPYFPGTTPEAVGGRTLLTDGAPGRSSRAPHRAKDEVARARDIRLETGQAIIAGIFIGWLGIATKAAINEAVGTNSYYVLLMAAAVLAAWVGGLSGGISAVVMAAVLNQVIFVNGESAPDAAQFLQALYIVTAVATVLLVASRRASRDRLADALDEVSTLAEEIEGRDARLQLMLSASGTGFWEWDIETGALTWSDESSRQHAFEPGVAAPEFTVYLDTIHPDDRGAFESAVGSTMEPGGPDTFELDFRVVWPDGAIHWTHGAGRLFRDEDGRPVRMIGMGQDITERRRILEDRDRLPDAERRAGAFREAFVDVISHELRTPITTIMGLAQILARPGRADDETSRMALLEDVRSEAERLHRLVEDLLVLSRVERGRLEVEAEPIEPRRLLDRIVSHEARELPTIEVETVLEPDLPIVAGESTYVEQIVRNLLNNAAKYTPIGSPAVASARTG